VEEALKLGRMTIMAKKEQSKFPVTCIYSQQRKTSLLIMMIKLGILLHLIAERGWQRAFMCFGGVAL